MGHNELEILPRHFALDQDDLAVDEARRRRAAQIENDLQQIVLTIDLRQTHGDVRRENAEHRLKVVGDGCAVHKIQSKSRWGDLPHRSAAVCRSASPPTPSPQAGIRLLVERSGEGGGFWKGGGGPPPPPSPNISPPPPEGRHPPLGGGEGRGGEFGKGGATPAPPPFQYYSPLPRRARRLRTEA